MKNIINVFITLSVLLINSYSYENSANLNFFELLNLEKNEQSKDEQTEIFRTGPLYLIYTPGGSYIKPVVSLMLDGRALCLFSFHLDENDKIVEFEEIISHDAATLHCHVLRKYGENPIIEKLVEYFH